MVRMFVGAIMVVGGIAAFIEAGSHAPGVECPRGRCGSRATELSHTAYDLLRIGGWSLSHHRRVARDCRPDCLRPRRRDCAGLSPPFF